MTDQIEAPRTIVAVKFGFSDKTYDYFADFPVEVGQKVYVPTKRGEAKVEIMAIKTESERAELAILRIVEPVQPEPEKAS
jgi:hypothetical protein